MSESNLSLILAGGGTTKFLQKSDVEPVSLSRGAAPSAVGDQQRMILQIFVWAFIWLQFGIFCLFVFVFPLLFLGLALCCFLSLRGGCPCTRFLFDFWNRS